RAGHDLDLRPAQEGVFLAGVEDPIEVLLLDTIGIDEHEPTGAEPCELLDDDATRSGAADDRDRKASELLRRCGPEELRMSPCKLGSVRRGRRRVPEVEVVAGDRHRLQ